MKKKKTEPDLTSILPLPSEYLYLCPFEQTKCLDLWQ